MSKQQPSLLIRVNSSDLLSIESEEEEAEFSLEALVQNKEIKALRSLDLSPFDINALELEVKLDKINSVNKLSSEETHMIIKEKRLATDVNLIITNTKSF